MPRLQSLVVSNAPAFRAYWSLKGLAESLQRMMPLNLLPFGSLSVKEIW